MKGIWIGNEMGIGMEIDMRMGMEIVICDGDLDGYWNRDGIGHKM